MIGVNSFEAYKRPVVDFDWSPKSVNASYTLAGNTYTYPATATQSVITFSIYTSSPPAGISLTQVDPRARITEIYWLFGDGSYGWGNSINKTFYADVRPLAVTCRITDSNYYSTSRTKTIVLRPSSGGQGQTFIGAP